MKRNHVTTELLRSVGEGQTPLAELFVRVYEHLREVCPHCADAVELYAREMEAEVLAEYDPVPEDRLPCLREKIQSRRVKLDRLREGLDDAVEELLSLPEEVASQMVRRGDTRQCNPLVVDRLLAESRELVIAEPGRAESLARLAEEVALHMPVEEFGVELANDLLLRAQINRANALRAGRDLEEADELVSLALVDRATSNDPLVHGEILRVAAALRRLQSRPEEALSHYDEATTLYREVGDGHLEGKTLLGRAMLHQDLHQPDQALQDLQRASTLIDREREPFLELCIHHNMAWYLCDNEQYGEAQAQLRAHCPLYRRFPSSILALRRQVLEGRIARGLGRPEEAKELFNRVRDSFLELGMPNDATLVSLDLALILAETGRTGELKELAAEMVTIFKAQGIHKEVMASLALFQQATAAEAVSLGLIRDLSVHLEAMFKSSCIQGSDEEPK